MGRITGLCGAHWTVVTVRDGMLQATCVAGITLPDPFGALRQRSLSDRTLRPGATSPYPLHDVQSGLRLHDAALSRLEAEREIHEALRHPRVGCDGGDHSGGGAARILRALPHQRLERLARLAAREERRAELLRVLLGPVLRAGIEVE